MTLRSNFLSCTHLLPTGCFLIDVLLRFLQEFLIKGQQLKESTAKSFNKTWIRGKKLAKGGQKIVKLGKNKAFAFTANKLLELSGTVTHPKIQSFLRRMAQRFSRSVTIEEHGNDNRELAIADSTRVSRKRNTNQVRGVSVIVCFLTLNFPFRLHEYLRFRHGIRCRFDMLAWNLLFLQMLLNARLLPPFLRCRLVNGSSFLHARLGKVPENFCKNGGRDRCIQLWNDWHLFRFSIIQFLSMFKCM
jgi:hypothetical protein